MVRILNFFCVALMGLSILALYHISEKTRVVHMQLGQVTNQIEVLPLSPADDGIRRAIYATLVRLPSLQLYFMQSLPPIRIIVKNGNVSLEGVVSNKADSDMAKIQASSVPGVFGVTNNLRVEK